MTAQSDIRNALVRLIKSVPNSGTVYPHYMYSSNWNTFLDQFMVILSGFKHVRGWWIAAPILPNTTLGDTFDSEWETLVYTIRGVMTVKTDLGTEEIFTDLVYAVRETLRTQGVLGFPGEIVDGSIECTVPVIDLRSFGSYLCHYTELRFSVGVNNPTNWVP